MVFSSGGSRPSDGGGGGGVGRSQKHLFSAFRALVLSRNKGKGDGRGGGGEAAPPLDPPLFNVFINCLRLSCCASFS